MVRLVSLIRSSERSESESQSGAPGHVRAVHRRGGCIPFPLVERTILLTVQENAQMVPLNSHREAGGSVCESGLVIMGKGQMYSRLRAPSSPGGLLPWRPASLPAFALS